ncbi:MAG: hypothetical protein N2443_03365 [Blastocatellia bacterium]|nr:hypothetical protein [Blastocatellia bacterium]
MPNGLTPEERREIRARLERAFEKSVADALMEVFERMAERQAEIALREDLRALHGVVQEIATALRNLQRVVAQLAEAQARTEERVGRLEEAVAQLAEAQARTEERVGRLEERTARLEEIVAQLIETQARTQEELRALVASHAEAIKRLERLEQIVAQVVETQQQMLEEQMRMQRTMRQLAQQLGAISETLGADLEDMAYIVLHDVLKRELGWDVEPLERTWKKWNDEMEEINIFGRAHDPRRPDVVIWIVGEAKYNLTVREVERFAQLVERAREHLKGEVFPVCFCRRARPEVEERVRELGFRLVYSYGRLL